MKVDISQLQGRQVYHQQYRDFDLADPELSLSEQPDLKLTLARQSDGVHAIGHVSAKVESACARCLTDAPVQVDCDFDLLYLPLSASVAQAGEHEIVEEQEFDLAYYEDDVIDVDDLVREQIELAMPVRLLCDEACKGLCATCGANLNETVCACPQQHDPRWDSLAGLTRNNEN